MFPPVEISDRKYLGKPRVAIRYDITVRTVDRWIKAKILPPPDLEINGRDYWDEAGLDRHDRQAVAERATKSKPAPNPSPTP